MSPKCAAPSAKLLFLAEVDPSSRPALLKLRSRLEAAEARVVELSAAEVVGRDMAAEAQRRALEARKDGDWQVAADLLADAAVTAQSLDSLLRSAGDLYSQLQRLMAEAASRVGRHLSRPELAVPLPDLETPLKLVLSNNGGPQAGPTLHLSAGERDEATIAAVIEQHSRQVLARRPISTIEQESTRWRLTPKNSTGPCRSLSRRTTACWLRNGLWCSPPPVVRMRRKPRQPGSTAPGAPGSRRARGGQFCRPKARGHSCAF